MNLNQMLFGVGLGLMLAGQATQAQQSETDRQALAELRAKAEKGDAQYPSCCIRRTWQQGIGG